MNDPVNDLIATLRPDEFTEDAYQRRRSADLARAIRSSHAPSSSHLHWRPWMSRRKPIFFIASMAAAGIAAAAIVIPGALSGNTTSGRPPSVAQPSDTGHLAARQFLLAAAATTMKEPADSGRYWYSKYQMGGKVRWSLETDDKASALSGELDDKAKKLSDKPEELKALVEEYRQKIEKVRRDGMLPFSASQVSSYEDWFARNHAEVSRTTGVHSKVTFASPADEEKWKGVGSPKLRDTSDKPWTREEPNMVNNSDYFAGAGVPTDKVGLEKWLREEYAKESKGAVQLGDVPLDWAENLKPSFSQWLFEVSQQVLAGQIKSGTRAALYQILAEQPGITTSGKVTDSLGRTGVALAMTGFNPWSGGDSWALQVGEQAEFRLIIDEETGGLLASDVRPEGQSTPTEWTVYENIGWVDKIGDIPQN